MRCESSSRSVVCSACEFRSSAFRLSPARAAVAAAPAIKVVITTGYPGHPHLLRSELPVLPKPFTRQDLDAMIRTLLDQPGLAPVGAA